MKPYYEDDLLKIYHGDCREVLYSLKKESVSLIVTSPPYNVGKSYEQGQTDLDFEYLLRSFALATSHALDKGRYLFMNIADRLCSKGRREGVTPVLPLFDRELIESGFDLYDTRIWKKNPAWMRDQWHSASVKSVQEFEYLYIYRKKGVQSGVYKITQFISKGRDKAGLTNKMIDERFGFAGMAGHWTSQKSQPEIPKREHWQELKTFLHLDNSMDKLYEKLEQSIRSRLKPKEWTEWGSRGVWEIRSVRRNNDHPAKFPVELPMRAIRLLSNDGDLVVDPFMGSGTTLQAARILNRPAIGIEKEERFCELAAMYLSQQEINLSACFTKDFRLNNPN